MKGRLISLAVMLACTAAAADYPASAGYVNDFTGTLPAAVQDALELRLRAYERATSNEVAVAIVPSLQGESIDDFARGLFRSWGLGKQASNNGALFLWAPTERKVRIQVGYGLESILTDQACQDILARVTPLLRENSYSEAVGTAVDGILQRLGDATPATPAPAPSPRPGSGLSVALLLAAVLGLAILLLTLHHHTTRTHELQRDVPVLMARCETLLQDARPQRAAAEAHLAELESQSPPEVWKPLESSLFDGAANLETLRRDLDQIHAQRREEYREMASAWRGLRRWQRAYEKQVAIFAAVARALERYLAAQAAALDSIPKMPAAFTAAAAHIAGAKNPIQAQELFSAAQQNFDQVRELRRNPPVNWLLVCDLLDDAKACLDRLAVLDQGTLPGPPHPPRSWTGSEKQSQAYRQLVGFAMLSQTDSGSGAGFSSGDTGGGGSFGGGDTGSGGASAGY